MYLVFTRVLVRVTVNVPLVEFMYLEFTRMPGKSYCRQLAYLLLYLRDIHRALINFLVCSFCNQVSVFTFHLTSLQLTEGSHFCQHGPPRMYEPCWRKQKRERLWNHKHMSDSLLRYPALLLFQCCFTSDQMVLTIKDGEPRTPALTFTQLWALTIHNLTFSFLLSCCYKVHRNQKAY